MPLFVDTNVFLYAAGREHPMRPSCRRIVAEAADGSIDITTSTEEVQEILYVLRRRNLEEKALELARAVMVLVPRTLSVTITEMRLARDLLEAVPGLNVRDAVHGATMPTAGIDAIVSVDRHFDSIPGLRRIPPPAVLQAS